jgi:hypothetical protein
MVQREGTTLHQQNNSIAHSHDEKISIYIEVFTQDSRMVKEYIQF